MAASPTGGPEHPGGDTVRPSVTSDPAALPTAPTLDDLVGAHPGPFALLHRPEVTGPEELELLLGDIGAHDRIADLPVPTSGPGGQDLVVLVPYRQLTERGLSCRDDHEPLLALSVRAQGVVTRQEALDGLPPQGVTLLDGEFDLDDETYAGVVDRVLREEIGQGAGSNFVIHRTFAARTTGEPVRAALALFRALLEQERGAYWTFVVHTGDRTFVGASPERHVSLADGTAVMNPISGTLRYPDGGPDPDDVLAFLDDPKETDELFMVVDEELKMMARVCDRGARVIGPRLKEMGRVAHTEYFLEGASSCDARDVLRETLFAPTVTGSPLENATRVIARHEPVGRSYYSGVIAVVGRDEQARSTLDSAILIRTAVLDGEGVLRLGVGATLVRDSDPAGEVAETWAKTAGVLSAARPAGDGAAPAGTAPPRSPLAADPRVRDALARRNTTLSRFWLGTTPAAHEGPLSDARCLLVDAEDTFTGMLAHILRSLGAEVVVRQHRDVVPAELCAAEGLDLVVLGPGPGDPRAVEDPKIATLRRLGETLLAGDLPFLSICLGHQVISTLLGLPVVPLPRPHQGTQRRIDLFGRCEPVGFYNSFCVHHDADGFRSPARGGPIEVSRDATTGQVHGLRGAGFCSVQFHPESILTQNGHRLLGDLVAGLLADRRPVPTG
jgi:2-amino-4-deoxychorismate synthase